jgi:hypothetical protein
MYISNTGGASTYIEIASADLPAWLSGTGASNSFVVGLWTYRPLAASTTFRTPFFIQNVLAVRNSNSAYGARVFDNTVSIATVTANIGADSIDQWVFSLVGWDKGAGTLHVCSKDNNGRAYGSIAAATGTHSAGNIYLLRNFQNPADGGGAAVPAWYGELGPCVVKNVQIATQAAYEAIVDAVYDSKNALGMLQHVGNGLNGLSDAEWLAFNVSLPQETDKAIVATATDGIRRGTTLISGATTNYTWIRKGSGATNSGDFDTVRPTVVVGTLTAADHEALVPSFFVRAVPGQTTNGINSVNSPICKRVALNQPRGLEKILVWSNSRGMRGTYYDAGPVNTELFYNYPGNHAHGYIGATFSKCAGFINSPVLDSLARRFGHDAPANPLSSGTIAQVSSGSTSYRDFTHFWTNSGRTNEGPGRGLALVSNGAYISHKARKAPGTLLDGASGSGWKHRVHLLKYPGAASVTVSLEESAAQNSAGTPVSIGTYNLDTSISETELFTGAYNSGTRTLVLPNVGLGAQAGYAVYCYRGTGLHGIAEIESVSEDTPIPGQTTLILRHAFAIAPSTVDSEFKIGPWSIQTVETDAALPTLEYQGLRITRDSVSSRIAVVLALDVWALGVSGWVWGQAGWGGNGYQPQTDGGALNLPRKIVDALGVDAVFMHNATQSTSTAQRETFAALLAQSLPANSIVFCSDQQHGTSETTSGTWATASLAQATYPAVVGMESPTVGDGVAQYATFQKANSAHPSFEGMFAIAQANIEQMAEFTDSGTGGAGLARSIYRRRRL